MYLRPLRDGNFELLKIQFFILLNSGASSIQLLSYSMLSYILIVHGSRFEIGFFNLQVYSCLASTVLEAEAEAVEAALSRWKRKRKRKRFLKIEWKRKRKRKRF